MDVYERNVHTSVSQVDDDHIMTRASLLDLAHNMTLQLKIRVSDRMIVEARGSMIKVPFEICRQVFDKIDGIVGLRIERGIAEKLSDKLGKSSGCTHLVELAVAACRISSNAMLGFMIGGQEWVEKKIPDEVFHERAMPFLKNSCLPFKE
jgi:hypothetical protein